jgi:hypothetical protein
MLKWLKKRKQRKIEKEIERKTAVEKRRLDFEKQLAEDDRLFQERLAEDERNFQEQMETQRIMDEAHRVMMTSILNSKLNPRMRRVRHCHQHTIVNLPPNFYENGGSIIVQQTW